VKFNAFDMCSFSELEVEVLFISEADSDERQYTGTANKFLCPFVGNVNNLLCQGVSKSKLRCRLFA
jgi:hypothetical protein